jgi:hypothetical protein
VTFRALPLFTLGLFLACSHESGNDDQGGPAASTTALQPAASATASLPAPTTTNSSSAPNAAGGSPNTAPNPEGSDSPSSSSDGAPSSTGSNAGPSDSVPSEGTATTPDCSPPLASGPEPAPSAPTAPALPDAPITDHADVNFNLDWRYHAGAVQGAEDIDFADDEWPYVDLPHSTKFVTPDDPNAELGVSVYRKHFTLPPQYDGLRLFLEFQAAMQHADVWVNGMHVAEHKGGYTPFSVDLTDAVTSDGSDNVISVALDNNASADWGPGWNGVDFQFHGGLYRNVVLHVRHPVHISDPVAANEVAGGGVFVTTPEVSAMSASVAIKTHVVNSAVQLQSITLLSEVFGPGGESVADASSSEELEPGASTHFAHELDVAVPELWHPDTPRLYTLRSTLSVDGQPVDVVHTRFGIRSIRWSREAGLEINGERLAAYGVNLHQEMYGLGNAVPDSAAYYDVKRVKDAGMNFIRGAHYPHAPAFYDACDELGVLVLDAQTGWQRYNATEAFDDNTHQELRDMLRRDRNHPSVVAWEASLNESNFSDAWARTAHEIVHAEYPGDQAYSVAWRGAFADIFGDASQHDTRESNDSRPTIINEFSDWDYGGESSTSRQAREKGDAAMLTQADNIEEGLSKNFALDWYSASSYWAFADYGGFSDYGITRCGLVDMYRLPKHSYYFMQSQRDPALLRHDVDSGPMVYIANLWTADSPTQVRVYSNCEEVSLYMGDELVATQGPDTGTSLPHPPFTFELGSFSAGTLRAEGTIGGMLAASTERRTPGAASALRLRPEGEQLRADGSDARLVFIDVVDANGSVVPTDSSPIELSLSGPGSLVGPSSIDAKGGQIAAWVRATREPGTITLTASADSLAAASVDLTSSAVAGLPAVPADR